MLRAPNRLIVRVSASGGLFAMTMLVMFASLFTLMRIGAAFPAVAGGAQVFDLQNNLTAEQVLDQLPGYSDDARQLYWLFTAIDYVFPFAAGLFLAAIATFCVRLAFPSAYAWITARNLLPLLMLGTLFDWCENVAAITAILAYPATSADMAAAIVVAKRLKLAMVMASWGVVALLLLAAGVTWVRGRLA
jgi:hypothetical protein